MSSPGIDTLLAAIWVEQWWIWIGVLIVLVGCARSQFCRESSDAAYDLAQLPYRIAVLCYLFDDTGRLLLLHRRKQPNAGMYSPIGGKLEVSEGESPHDCAIREIQEEAGLQLADEEIRILGVVSETAYEQETHWLIFLYEVVRPIRSEEIARLEFDEGTLEWVEEDRVETLPIPKTDLKVMWPNVRKHRGGFFAAHIDCRKDPFTWQLQESILPNDSRVV